MESGEVAMVSDPSAAALERLFDALGDGDVAAAVSCLAPDARVWHGFDGVAHDRDGIARDWAGFVAAFPQRAFVDIRRRATADGFVQQHLMVGHMPDGTRKAWPACVVVRMRDGLIARLDEYIDRAGAFEPADAASLVTPGLD